MTNLIELLPSGINFIDRCWGGFYRAGSYIAIGKRGSGKALAGMQFALASARRKERCLYLTNMKPRDLLINAASIDFDIQAYMNQELIIVIRVAQPASSKLPLENDLLLADYLNDAIKVIEQYNPSSLVFDEITPYVSFENINSLEKTFESLLEKIQQKNVTSLFLIGEPASQAAYDIVSALKKQVNGSISFSLNESDTNDNYGIGKILLEPNIGHPEGQFSAFYSIEPKKGIVVDFRQPIDRYDKSYYGKFQSEDERFISISKIPASESEFDNINLYDYDEFILLLNNLISLYRSQNEIFTLLAFKLSPEAEKEGIIKLNQLLFALKRSISKREKICLFNDRILILIPKSDEKKINDIISRLKQNLPVKTDELEKALNLIGALRLDASPDFKDSQDLIKIIFENEENKYPAN